MAHSASFLRWRVLFPSGPMAVDDLVNRIATFESAGVKDGGCHDATAHSCGNGCALSVRFYSCTDHGFGCDRCAVVRRSDVLVVV